MTSKSIQLVLVAIALLFSFCKSGNEYQKSHYDLSPTKTASKVHVSEGVWIDIPVEYKKAKSYKGYQTADNWSSLSVKLSPLPIQYLKQQYSIDKLEAMDRELLEISTVKYGDIENAFFVVIHDKLKSTIRYLLAIQQTPQTSYLIKGWSFFGAKELYDNTIREAILSAYIGDKIADDDLFKLAENNRRNLLVFTKDSLNPTQHVDQSTIEVILNPYGDGKGKRAFIMDHLTELTGVKTAPINSNQFSPTSSYLSTKGIGKKKKAIIGLVQEENGNKTLIKAYGNLDSSLEEFEAFIEMNFFKTSVNANGKRKLF